MKNKKGVSVMIGYILLIVAVTSMSIVVYAWLNSYLPQEQEECPEGVSIFVKSHVCNKAVNTLKLTLINNGRFTVDGFYVFRINKDWTKASIVQNFDDGQSGIYTGDFVPTSPEMKPNNEVTIDFIFTANIGDIKSVEIIPLKGGSTCGEALINEVIECV